MITIDGSFGEGGGQIIRTSLGLSALTGQAFRIENIRAGRKKPGLLRQHLTAVRAATEITNATVTGDELGSKLLTFKPGPVQAGEYSFAIGSAGSATLVLQTVLPALMTADGPSQLLGKGGTHNAWAPPFDFLRDAFGQQLARIGPKMELDLIRPGFYPAGGGEFLAVIEPARTLTPLELTERGEIVGRKGRAIVAKLDTCIAERELKVVRAKLGWDNADLVAERADSSVGPGNIVMLEVRCEHVTEVFTAFGARDVRAEHVAGKAVKQVRDYLAAGVPVDEYLADQLLIPVALAGGVYRTAAPSQHTKTNIDVIHKFLDARLTCERIDHDTWEIATSR